MNKTTWYIYISTHTNSSTITIPQTFTSFHVNCWIDHENFYTNNKENMGKYDFKRKILTDKSWCDKPGSPANTCAICSTAFCRHSVVAIKCVLVALWGSLEWSSHMGWGYWLTHLPLDKMAAISQIIFANAFLRMKSFVFWSKFHKSLFLRVPINNKSELVKIMAWCLIGAKPLSEPMLTQFSDPYMQH